jgi:hypothetical protein
VLPSTHFPNLTDLREALVTETAQAGASVEGIPSVVNLTQSALLDTGGYEFLVAAWGRSVKDTTLEAAARYADRLIATLSVT